MSDVLNSEYIEVREVLDILGDEYKKRLPKKIMMLFEQNRTEKSKVQNKKIKVEDIKLSRKALTIISILNLKYWETDPVERERLKNIYDENEKEYQEKINIYKQDDWLKRKNVKEEKQSENTEEVSLISEKDINIIQKIKRFFRNLFSKRK